MSAEHLPPRVPVDRARYTVLRDLVAGGGVLVLTGAGMSTASGIPDYRGPDGQRRVRPMQHDEFTATAQARQRYWARAHAGWERFGAARPNGAHRVLAALERDGYVDHVITQNVDGLHQRAGSSSVLELHGSLDRVVCLDCGERSTRQAVQEDLVAANPGYLERVAGLGDVRPDGDVGVPEAWVSDFRVPRCRVCRGDALKPDVVFFGGAVDRSLVERAFAMLGAARLLLVVGSSLRVMSGYRFVRRAARDGVPVAVLTRGEIRGEGEPEVHLDALLSDVLPELAADLGVPVQR